MCPKPSAQDRNKTSSEKLLSRSPKRFPRSSRSSAVRVRAPPAHLPSVLAVRSPRSAKLDARLSSSLIMTHFVTDSPTKQALSCPDSHGVRCQPGPTVSHVQQIIEMEWENFRRARRVRVTMSTWTFSGPQFSFVHTVSSVSWLLSTTHLLMF